MIYLRTLPEFAVNFRKQCMYIVAFNLLLCGLAFAELRELELGGFRQIKAKVQHNEGSYQCEIEFLPVSCFDAATNKKINLSKSRGYAMRALAMSSGITTGTVKAVNLRVSKPLEVISNRAVIQYLADNIEILEAAEKQNKTRSLHTVQKKDQELVKDKISVSDVNTRTLLSCLDDLRSILQELDHSIKAEIADLKPGDTLEDAVADLEERSVAAFVRLEAMTSGEKLLLSIEKNELIADIRVRRREFIQQLKNKYSALSE